MSRIPSTIPQFKRTFGSFFQTLLPMLGLLIAAAAVQAAVTDNFNDGNDDGWTRYDPLGNPLIGLGPQTLFICTNGVYHILGSATPDIANLGPGRGGSFITTATYTDFYVSADIISWDTNVHQIFGLCARMSELGLGTTDGYLLDLDFNPSNPTTGDLDIALVTDEGGYPIEVGPSTLTLVPGASYRLVFMGKGADLDGFVYQLPNTNTPILHITANDTTYASGFSGLLVADEVNTSAMDVVAPDAIFDNYYAASVEIPPSLMITSDSLAKTATITWAAYPGYILQSTTSLNGTPVWIEETPTTTSSTVNSFETPIGASNKYFRLKRPL